MDKSVVEFMETLCELENYLLVFEEDFSRQRLRVTGLSGTRELGDLERRHPEYVDELQRAYRGIVTGRFTELNRYLSENNHDWSRYEMHAYQEDF